MTVDAKTAATGSPSPGPWYTRPATDVVAALQVDPAAGLSAARARELLDANGPNALPEEKATPGWRRFLDQYRSYMQIILLVAAVVSLLISEWSTAVLLLLLTLVNAVGGLRQEGKAVSAMNALKSMMKATARVRRDGADAAIPAEELVPGDVVLLAAGDLVPADGRLLEARDFFVNEALLTGESYPAEKQAHDEGVDSPEVAEATNAAFMGSSVMSGSARLIVCGTGLATQLGQISSTLRRAPPPSAMDQGTHRFGM